MGRKARSKRDPKDAPVSSGSGLNPGPNLPLLALSVIGILLAGYLTWTESVGSALQGCTEGSGCDVVLSSRWGTLMGAPTAQWGLLAYGTLAAIALFVRNTRLHWKLAWTMAFFGVCYSAYLTTVSLTILGATCPYCLSSFALMTTIFGLVTWQRPEMSGFAFPQWAGVRASAAVVLIGLLHLNYTGVIGEPPAVEDPVLRALAVHLSESGAKMYGASWCPHCQQQKAMFGASAHRLPYVECSTGGQGSPQAAICANLGIKIYPTWVINGVRTEETIPTDRLASLTGFQPPAAAAAPAAAPAP